MKYKILKPPPLHLQVYELLRREIEENHFSGSQLPTERTFEKQFLVSRPTIHKAISLLQKEGLVYSIQGKGTFINKSKLGEKRFIFKRNTRVIGLCISIAGRDAAANNWWSELLKGMEEEAKKEDFHLLFTTVKNYSEEEKTYKELAKSGYIEGFILFSHPFLGRYIEELEKNKLPFVIVGRYNKESGYYIEFDNIQGGFLATDHLIKQGCRRIAYIGGPEGFTVSEDRLKGYRTALEKNGLSIDNSLIKQCNFTEKDGHRVTTQLLGEKRSFDGIVCIDDATALGAMRAIQEKGLRIPEDIGIVGANNSYFCSHLNPPLTSVEVFPYKEGILSVKMLIKLINNKKINKSNIVLKPKLVIRKSSMKKMVSEIKNER